MGLLRNAAEMVHRRLKESDGVEVVYSRRVLTVTHTVPFVARHGLTVFAGLTETAISVQWGERDWLVDVADLVLPVLGATTPMRGDRIFHVAEGTTWEVSSPQSDEPVYRSHDLWRLVWRIHTKRVVP